MERIINLGDAIQNTQQSIKQITEDDMKLSLLNEIIQDVTVRLWQSVFEDEFMKVLEAKGIIFASEAYKKLQIEQYDEISDSVIYYDQKLEYLKLQRAALMKGMKG